MESNEALVPVTMVTSVRNDGPPGALTSWLRHDVVWEPDEPAEAWEPDELAEA